MQKIIAPLIGLGLIALLAFVWLAPSGVQAAPNFQLQTIDGNSISKADLIGKPAFITFWATSCVGCVAEQPHIKQLQDKYAAQGLNILAIAMNYDPIDQIHTMRSQRQLNYPIAHDSDGVVAKAFGDVRLTPTNILLDTKGNILFQKLGEVDFKLIDQQIKGLL